MLRYDGQAHTGRAVGAAGGKGLSELLLNARSMVLTKKLLPALQPLFFAVAYAIYNETSSQKYFMMVCCAVYVKVAVLVGNEYFYGSPEFSIPDYQSRSP